MDWCQWRADFRAYHPLRKYLSFWPWLLLAYVITAILVLWDWRAAAIATVLASREIVHGEYLTVVGRAGHPPSVHICFSGRRQEEEEVRFRGQIRPRGKEHPRRRANWQNRIDTYAGNGGVQTPLAFFSWLRRPRPACPWKHRDSDKPHKRPRNGAWRALRLRIVLGGPSSFTDWWLCRCLRRRSVRRWRGKSHRGVGLEPSGAQAKSSTYSGAPRRWSALLPAFLNFDP